MFEEPPDAAARVVDPVASSASKLWTERVNPTWWQCLTWVGDWVTEDRITWRTADRRWLVQLQRSANRRHTFLAFWRDGHYVGFHDNVGWHPATERSRKRRPRAEVRSLPLPLTLAR